jgi:DNA ligase-1
MITKPMLASKCENPSALRFPLLATPKLDGIRCLKIGGRALSRTFKPIRNTYVREWIEHNCPDGMDGELIVKGVPFNEVAGHIGRESGQPDFTFAVFDYVKDIYPLGSLVGRSYRLRTDDLAKLPNTDRVNKILPIPIDSLRELGHYEQMCIADGYEGVMIRTPDSPYKCGRSTEKEGFLLKIKRFEDAEAIITACIEGMSNLNPAEKDAFGRTKRSSCKENKVGRDTLGAFVCRDIQTGHEFSLSGFTESLAADIWSRRAEAVGRIVKYKHQPSGAKEAPRFPKFAGFREAWDL